MVITQSEVSTLSKTRDIPCSYCADHPMREAEDVCSGPCPACRGYGLVSAHSLSECWCDGTAAAPDHEDH